MILLFKKDVNSEIRFEKKGACLTDISYQLVKTSIYDFMDVRNDAFIPNNYLTFNNVIKALQYALKFLLF